MNKKAYSTLGIVITIAIILACVGIIIAIFWGELLPEVVKGTKRLEGVLPGKPGQDAQISSETAPERIKEIFDTLYNKFDNMKGKENCYTEYKSLNMGEYSIELEYIERREGLNMRLLNKKGNPVAEYFIKGIQPCIALPDKKDNIAKVRPLSKVDIRNNNKIYYNNKRYSLFDKYPLLYAPKENDWACFFTDDKVKDPIDKTTYGATLIRPDGFDENDMSERNKGSKC